MNNQIKDRLGKIILGLGLVLIVVATSATSIYLSKSNLFASLIHATVPSVTGDKQINMQPSGQIELAKSTKLNLSNLSFSSIERHEVPNAKKTIIYIPQIHREPTSVPADPKNDKALGVQTEIASMVNQLADKNGIKYVMDETDLYGPMPPEKVNNLKTGLTNIAKFKKDLDTTLALYVKAGGSASTAATMKQKAMITISKQERLIYLTGGAAVAAAQNNKITPYGSQNSSTIEITKAKLQNLVFMEKRISQLEGDTQSSSSASSAGELSSMLQSSQAAVNPLTEAVNYAQTQNNPALAKATQAAHDKLKTIASKQTYEATPTTPTAQPTNPYRDRTDLTSLKNEYQVAQTEFMKLAKDVRSQEVVVNVEKMMTDNGQTASVLVFGIGHKEQLIDMFNKKGISIIVVTPTSQGPISA